MNKLLTAAIAAASALALNAAIAERSDPVAPKAPGDYTVMKDNCTSRGGASRDQCLKGAKIPVTAPADPCAKLMDREKRECILEEFVQKHDR